MLVLKSGGDFHFKDVELLARKIHEHWASEEQVQVYCLFDKIEAETALKNVILVPMTYKDWPGWWSKMNLFSPDLSHLRPFLFFDLDTAIVGDISYLFDKVGNQFVTLEDFYRPKVDATGMVFVPSEDERMDKIWRDWLVNPALHMKNNRGDMHFIGKVMKADNYFQKVSNKIINFKPRKDWLVELPENISIVCFHGKPRIWDAATTINWVKDYVR